MGAAAVTVAALDTTVTVGTDLWFGAGTEGDFYAYGFNDALADPVGIATIGSIGDSTYTDASSTSRTVSGIFYTEHTGGLDPSDEDSIWFGLVGTSIADSDTTFREIVYNGQTYVRSSADAYYSSVGAAATYWQWQYVIPNGPSGGTVDFEVIL